MNLNKLSNFYSQRDHWKNYGFLIITGYSLGKHTLKQNSNTYKNYGLGYLGNGKLDPLFATGFFIQIKFSKI